jgi:hypothetical protein
VRSLVRKLENLLLFTTLFCYYYGSTGTPLGLALYEIAYISTIKVVEAPVPKVGYKIPTGQVRKVMEHRFNGDGSKSMKEQWK